MSEEHSRLCIERLEQRFCLFEIGSVETFGEPGVDRREKVAGIGKFPLITPKPGEAGGSAQLEPARTLVARKRE